MNDKKIDELVKDMEAFRKKIAKSKKASRNFLIHAGIVNKNGRLTAPYKHLCIPQEQV